MQKIIPSILTISLLLTGYGIKPVMAEKPYLIAQSVWSKFTSEEYGFSILMPGKPLISNESVVMINGKKLNSISFFTNQYNKAYYVISVVDFNSVPNKEEQIDILKQFFTEKVSESHAQLISEKDIIFNNYSGEEFQIKVNIDNTPYSIKDRAYFVKNKIYVITTRISDDMISSLSVSTQGFLDSFQLLNP